jgi:hypothetical protein
MISQISERNTLLEKIKKQGNVDDYLTLKKITVKKAGD